MLDLRAVSSGGGTTLTDIGTILAGGDGQTVAGVPINPQGRGVPTLMMWGGLSTIADTIREIRLRSLDQIDSQNAEYKVIGTGSLRGINIYETALPFKGAQRVIAMRQNTAAANNIGFFLDAYPNQESIRTIGYPSLRIPNRLVDTEIFTGALTAITWGTQAWAPSIALQDGFYAILGVWISALTNYALIRFTHSSFGQYKPGFPVIDATNTAVANAVMGRDPFFNFEGFQFVYLGQCPVFKAGAQGSGLTMEMASITADTPNVVLNLAKVG